MSPTQCPRNFNDSSFQSQASPWGEWRAGVRSGRATVFVVVACAALIACAPDTARTRDAAHTPIFLPPPYDALPPAPPGTPIEPGRPVSLNARQRQAVVMSGVKWMKDPASGQFSGIKAVRNGRSLITACGPGNGPNKGGKTGGGP